MKAGARRSSVGALIFGLMVGCQASVNADANVSGQGASAEGEADLHGSASGQAEGAGEMTRAESLAAGNPSATTGENLAPTVATGRVLLGARHDLKLRQGKATATCQCLAVALGGSRSSGMVWSAAPPDIDETVQLSLALSSEDQDCKGEPKKSLGASYWGYRISGNDVIVLVEASQGGHPMTNGAIIPKPVGPGQVYVAPASKKLPYGRAAEGKGLCKIGNPGAPRTAAFTELEIGSNAPPAPSGNVTNGRALSDPSEDMPATIEMPSN